MDTWEKLDVKPGDVLVLHTHNYPDTNFDDILETTKASMVIIMHDEDRIESTPREAVMEYLRAIEKTIKDLLELNLP